MNPHPIDQYLNVVTGCLGAEFDYLFEMPDDERDLGFKLNFANKQEQIISKVNALVLPDLRFFSDLLEAFISEVKANFNSADAHQAKQRYADRIAAKVDIIQKGVDRLARTLRDEWSLPQDPRFSYFFSHKDIALYGQRIQYEIHLKGLFNSGRTEEEAQMARRNLDAYRGERREGESHLFFALLIADWTERFLSGYLALYCSRTDAPIIYNKSSPDELIIISSFARGTQEILLGPASDQQGSSNTTFTNEEPQTAIFNSFEELFIRPEYIPICVDALRNVRPDAPIISDTRCWQKRHGSKAVLAAWIRRMEDCDKIMFVSEKTQLVPLLNNYFPNLNLGVHARTLKDPDKEIVLEFSALILP